MDEYRTTKAFPVSKDYDSKMKCLKGAVKYYNHRFKKEYRKDIHRLSNCTCCKSFFSRRVDEHLSIVCELFPIHGVPLEYLRKTNVDQYNKS